MPRLVALGKTGGLPNRNRLVRGTIEAPEPFGSLSALRTLRLERNGFRDLIEVSGRASDRDY
jgi:hypothetical protein